MYVILRSTGHSGAGSPAVRSRGGPPGPSRAVTSLGGGRMLPGALDDDADWSAAVGVANGSVRGPRGRVRVLRPTGSVGRPSGRRPRSTSGKGHWGRLRQADVAVEVVEASDSLVASRGISNVHFHDAGTVRAIGAVVGKGCQTVLAQAQLAARADLLLAHGSSNRMLFSVCLPLEGAREMPTGTVVTARYSSGRHHRAAQACSRHARAMISPGRAVLRQAARVG